MHKLIKLPGLNAATDSAALAKRVVDKCDLIHPSQLNEVEYLIEFLKNRNENLSQCQTRLQYFTLYSGYFIVIIFFRFKFKLSDKKY